MEPRKWFSVLAILGCFVYFVSREAPVRETVGEENPEDVLIAMVQAMERGDVQALEECFGGDLKRRLEDLLARDSAPWLAEWLRRRGSAVKGLAILDQEELGPDQVRILTETVYNDRNTRQSFRLEREDGSWRVTDSDFEMVSDWENEFGKSIRDVGRY